MNYTEQSGHTIIHRSTNAPSLRDRFLVSWGRQVVPIDGFPSYLPCLPDAQLPAIENKMPMRGHGELAHAWRQACTTVYQSLDATISETVSNNLREDLWRSIPNQEKFMDDLEGPVPVHIAYSPLLSPYIWFPGGSILDCVPIIAHSEGEFVRYIEKSLQDVFQKDAEYCCPVVRPCRDWYEAVKFGRLVERNIVLFYIDRLYCPSHGH